jgi:hypothetical protein
MPIRLHDEPSKTDVCGLTMSVEYDRNEAGIWSATLRHPNIGSYTSHEFTPSRAREKTREKVAASIETLTAGNKQKIAHSV